MVCGSAAVLHVFLCIKFSGFLTSIAWLRVINSFSFLNLLFTWLDKYLISHMEVQTKEMNHALSKTV